jgi:hypothetical protein
MRRDDRKSNTYKSGDTPFITTPNVIDEATKEKITYFKAQERIFLERAVKEPERATEHYKARKLGAVSPNSANSSPRKNWKPKQSKKPPSFHLLVSSRIKRATVNTLQVP